MQIKQLLLIAPVALALHACSSDSNYNFEESAAAQTAAFAAAMRLACSLIQSMMFSRFPTTYFLAQTAPSTYQLMPPILPTQPLR